MKIVCATHNRHKIEEISAQLAGIHEIVTLSEIGCFEDIPEDEDTFAGNALQKARYVKQHYGFDCFADDSGLEAEALGNRPGVYSARYAGEDKDSDKNIDKLLGELEDADDRRARFRTVIAFVTDSGEYLFEGKIEGEIMRERHGTGGFGYDPIFRPQGYECTFAEMSSGEKNLISHRAIAVKKLSEFIKENF